MPPPKLWVFSTITSARHDLVGPDAGDHERRGIVGRSSRPRSQAQVRDRDARERRGRAELGPQRRGRASRRRSSSPGADVQAHAELVGHRPGGREQPGLVAEQRGHASPRARARVGSSPKTSSPTSARAIASRIAVGGRVRVSRAGHVPERRLVAAAPVRPRLRASRRRGTPARATAGGSAAGRRPTRSGSRGRRRSISSAPPRHSVTSSPVSSTWMPPGKVPRARCTSKKPCTSSTTSSKSRVL